MRSTSELRAPRHLSTATRAWWRGIATEFVLESHHLALLTLAGEAWDRAIEARERVARDGAYFADRFGQVRVHPAVGVERDARIAFVRCLAALDLDTEPPKGTGRPPGGDR